MLRQSLLAEQLDLDVFRGPLIGLSVLEQVTVQVKGHLDRRVAYEDLNALLVPPVLNPQRGAGWRRACVPYLPTVTILGLPASSRTGLPASSSSGLISVAPGGGNFAASLDPAQQVSKQQNNISNQQN